MNKGILDYARNNTPLCVTETHDESIEEKGGRQIEKLTPFSYPSPYSYKMTAGWPEKLNRKDENGGQEVTIFKDVPSDV